jgi:hypothetical protein
MVNGMLSYGNWFYNGNATSTRYTVSNQLFGVRQYCIWIKLKLTMRRKVQRLIGATYELAKRVK